MALLLFPSSPGLLLSRTLAAEDERNSVLQGQLTPKCWSPPRLGAMRRVAALCREVHSRPTVFPAKPAQKCSGVGRQVWCSASSVRALSEADDLKSKLIESLEKSNYKLSEEDMEIVSKLEQLNPTQNPAHRPDLFGGPFKALSAVVQGLEGRGFTVTLGRATFNSFKPVDLQIRLEDIFNDLNVHKPDSYFVNIPFTICQPGTPPLEGLLCNEAGVSASSNIRLDINFLGSSLMPKDSSVDLSQWLGIFKGVNEGMGDDGVCQLRLPPAKGWLDIIYLDEELRITRGNRGTVVVVQRMPAPAIVPLSVCLSH